STLKSPSYTKSVSWQHYPTRKTNTGVIGLNCAKFTFNCFF
ncbi:transposase, partial [Shigella dysenteriae]